jgi:hypothetical protein
MRKILLVTGLFILASLILTLVLVQKRSDNRSRAADTDIFTFTAAGDYHNKSQFSATVDAVAKEQPAFNIALGDFSYTPGGEAAWCSTWQKTYKNLILITGNHDSGESNGGNVDVYRKQCPYPLQGGVKGDYGKQYYFDYPDQAPLARFILIAPGLDGNVRYDYTKGGNGYQFTEQAINDARQKNIPWIFAGFHKNCISAGEVAQCAVETDIMDLLIAKKVDVILQGHEHNYQRSKQLKCMKIDSYDASCVAASGNSLKKGDGTIIHIMGTGGRNPHTIDSNDPEYKYFDATQTGSFGVGKFTVSRTGLLFEFVNAGGDAFTDSFTIGNKIVTDPTKKPTQSEPQATATETPSNSKTPTPSVTGSQNPSPTVTGTQSATPTEAPTGFITVTPTDNPEENGSQEIEVSLVLDGIGRGGDNTNRKDTTLSNKNPLTTSREVDFEFFDRKNISVTTAEGFLDYNPTQGSFTGTLVLAEPLPDASYMVRVTLENYLAKRIPQPLVIKTGKTSLLPETYLITGDINGDNALSILDYNGILECYGTDAIPDGCNTDHGITGDLNDDGKVLEADLNLFIREITVHEGD